MLSIGMNRKLKAGKIAVFNLPAGFDICGRECPGCYAKKAQRIYKAVLPSRLRNLEASRKADFVDTMVKEINDNKHRFRAVRVHESGDFYDQKYITSWESIAKKAPDVIFYAYTKRIDELKFDEIKKLKNFILIDSTAPGPINYGSPEQVSEWERNGHFVCPAGKNSDITCNNGCDYCLTKKAQDTGVVFIKH